MKIKNTVIYFAILICLASHGQVAGQGIAKEENQVSLKYFLSLLEERHGVFFIYESEVLESISDRIPMTTIDLSLDSVLHHLHQLTSLQFRSLSDKTIAVRPNSRHGYLAGVVRDPNGRPIVGATIYIPALKQGTVTELDGTYRLELYPGEWQVTYSHVGWQDKLTHAPIARGNTYTRDIILQQQPYLQEVTVIGSRISPSTMIDNATVVTIVQGASEKNSWYSELSALLQNKIPSFHSTHQTISDGTDHIDPAALRGLGPDQVLVLVNGKRRHQSALVNINGTVGKGTVSTDLNTIPVSAIDRIEVLQDGASVLYGSDAIAGVINIILKEQATYSEVVMKTGISHRGDGATFDLSSNFGFDLSRAGGHLDLSFNYLGRGNVNRSDSYTGPVYGDERDDDPTALKLFHSQTGYSQDRVMSVGSSAMRGSSMFFNVSLPLIRDRSFYAFGGLSYKDGLASGFYRLPYQLERQSGSYPLGFSPKLDTDIGDQSLTMGFTQNRSGWKIDVSNTIGRNAIDMRVVDSNNASYGPDSPNSAHVGGFSYIQNTTNIDAQIKHIKDTDIDLGIGVEYRIESYEQHTGEEVSWRDYGYHEGDVVRESGIQMFPGFRPENAIQRTRQNVGFYANLEADVIQALKIGAAGRFEHYDGFAKNLSWRIYSRLQMSQDAVLKASWNTGFRAPSMPQIYFSTLSSQFVSTPSGQESIRIAQFNNESLIAREFGIEALTPERSVNYNIGLVLRPVKDLSFTLNAYQIEIKDRIVITGRFRSQDDEEFQRILAPLGVGSAQFFTNAVDTRTRGIESSVSYQVKVGGGTIDLSVSGMYTATRLRRDNDGSVVIRTSEILEGHETTLFNREEVSRLESVQPSDKIILSAKYSLRSFDFATQVTRYGSVQYVNPTDATRDQSFSGKWLTDINATWYPSDLISLSGGVANIFAVYPDRHTHEANLANGLFPYSRRVRQFNIRGAYWYTKIGLRF